MVAGVRRGTVFVCALVVLSVGIAGCKPAAEEKQPPAPIQQTVVVFEGVAPEDEVLLKDLLRVDGVLVQGTQYICSINGQICNVGENLEFNTSSRTYTLRLIAITGDRVVLSAEEGR